jgi:uncharacterized protein (UPF0332 family)
MTGRDFFACAERLSQSSSEADLRSAVSRAYYGAFHHARELLRKFGVILPKTEQVHIKVGYCLLDCGDQDAATAGQQLEELRSQRKTADYDLDSARFTTRGAVSLEIARARRILETLDKCSSKTATAVRDKIRAHAKLIGLSVTD